MPPKKLTAKGERMNRNNKVSAVIPTRNRPDLVLRAVRSALAQSHENLEVIVVVDGPDAATSNALKTIGDDRLRVIVSSRSQGVANARNMGVEAADGDWIAFLDDDDEWLPEKTTLQMERANASTFRYPIVCSQLYFRTPKYELVWPRRQPYEPLSEYLLARNSWSMGEGLLSPITVLFPKCLFSYANFNSHLIRCEDVDWILRVSNQDGAGIEFIPRPLAVAHQAAAWASLSSVPDWRGTLEWIESIRETITPRAYASCIATTVAAQAVRQGDWAAFLLLIGLILRRGSPTARDLAFFLTAWIAPQKLKLIVRKAGL